MTITRSNGPLRQADAFIGSAPDALGARVSTASGQGLKTKRGIRRSQVSVVLPDAVLAALDTAAKQRYMSRSALLTMLIDRFVRDEQ